MARSDLKLFLDNKSWLPTGWSSALHKTCCRATRVPREYFYILPSALKFKALFSSPSDIASPILEHSYTEKPVQLLESQQIPQISLGILSELQGIL